MTSKKTLKVLLLGSNPSNKSADNSAFHESTQSGRILKGWLEGISGEFVFENITSQKTENNRPLNQEERAQAKASLLERIKEINPDRIVALGKHASEMVSRLGLKYLELPHPSGLNRKLNDKDYVAECLNRLRAYCTSSES